MNLILIKLVKASHLLVLVYILSGWALPASSLMFYMFCIMTVIVQWELNSGTCVLTNLEFYLKGDSRLEPKEEQEGHFLKGVIHKTFGFVPTDRVLKSTVYVVMYLFFLIAMYRVS